jgi:hypothetical protein
MMAWLPTWKLWPICTRVLSGTPLDHDWTEIYLYLATKVTDSRLSSDGVQIPADIKVEQLDSYLEGKLIELKRWIRERQKQAIAERWKADNRQEREEMATKRKAAQPALFDF